MKCNHCGSDWSAGAGMERKWEKCPFCGMPLAPEAPAPGSVQDVLMRIHGQFGGAVFENDRKLLAIFSDLAPGLIPQRRLLKMLLKCDGHRKLLAVKDSPQAEQTACVNRLAVEMNETLFIDESAAKMICQAVLDAFQVPVNRPAKTPDVPKEPEVSKEPELPQMPEVPEEPEASKAVQEQLGALVTVLSALLKKRKEEQKKEQLKALTRMLTEQFRARNAAQEQIPKADEPVNEPEVSGDVTASPGETEARAEQLRALVMVLSALYEKRKEEQRIAQRKEQLKALTHMVTQQLKARNAALEQAKNAPVAEPVTQPAEPAPAVKPVSAEPVEPSAPAAPSAEPVQQAKTSEEVMVSHDEVPNHTLAMNPPSARRLVPTKAADPQRERFRSYQSRSSEGDLDAMFMLGWCYEKGEGVAVNEPVAVHCYEFAIDHGEDHSIRALMELWERKEPLTVKDLETAQRLMGKNLNAHQELMLRNVLSFAGTRIAKLMVAEPQFCSAGSMLLKKCADSGNEVALKHLSAGDGTDGGIALNKTRVMKMYNQYGLRDKYILPDSKVFAKKCLKAIGAYAYLEPGEIPLLLEDTSRFGSGKEGILLTDHALYVKQGKANSYRIKPDRIMSVSVTPPGGDGRRQVQFLCTSDGNRPFKVCFTFCDSEDEANRMAGFWKTLLGK